MDKVRRSGFGVVLREKFALFKSALKLPGRAEPDNAAKAPPLPYWALPLDSDLPSLLAGRCESDAKSSLFLKTLWLLKPRPWVGVTE